MSDWRRTDPEANAVEIRGIGRRKEDRVSIWHVQIISPSGIRFMAVSTDRDQLDADASELLACMGECRLAKEVQA